MCSVKYTHHVTVITSNRLLVYFIKTMDSLSLTARLSTCLLFLYSQTGSATAVMLHQVYCSPSELRRSVRCGPVSNRFRGGSHRVKYFILVSMITVLINLLDFGI